MLLALEAFNAVVQSLARPSIVSTMTEPSDTTPPTTFPMMDLFDGPLGERIQAAQDAMLQMVPKMVPGFGSIAENPLDTTHWNTTIASWFEAMPLTDTAQQMKMMQDGAALWQTVMGQFGLGPDAGSLEDNATRFPYQDRRFADDRWRTAPLFALLHQTYLMFSERLNAMVDEVPDLSDAKREQLRFTTRAITEALSPANFPITNPLVIERTLDSGGENLRKGMEHMLADMKKGQLTHTDPDAFKVGENIAVTPGKVVHETPLYQLIQYSPATDNVLAVPLVIFPPWINRFYILDLNPEKSFVKWAVDQGLTVFMVSWKSADASMADVVWDDYIRAQMDAIDVVTKRLKVPSIHTIGYCVAGTTLAATLSIMAQRGLADRIKSATFFTAQVDFSKAGELLNLIDDRQSSAIENLATDGYIDGRYIAAAFNMLRGTDLIWNYVIRNYLLGEDYPAFDLLHWNGDVTNLPAKWHGEYLRDLYRGNKLVQPGALLADGTPIDLTVVATPSYIQAGREDHIAPADSVWQTTRHFNGPVRFVLAGSGHIAGVVNPPAAEKYQYWTNENDAASLAEFTDGATEHPGSWWPDWIDWIAAQDNAKVKSTGKRKPGSGKDKVIEDAPGRYVKSR